LRTPYLIHGRCYPYLHSESLKNPFPVAEIDE
jgi:hypothetical protein